MKQTTITAGDLRIAGYPVPMAIPDHAVVTQKQLTAEAADGSDEMAMVFRVVFRHGPEITVEASRPLRGPGDVVH